MPKHVGSVPNVQDFEFIRSAPVTQGLRSYKSSSSYLSQGRSFEVTSGSTSIRARGSRVAVALAVEEDADDGLGGRKVVVQPAESGFPPTGSHNLSFVRNQVAFWIPSVGASSVNLPEGRCEMKQRSVSALFAVVFIFGGLAVSGQNALAQSDVTVSKRLTAAAENGDIAAQHKLCLDYYNGQGVAQDYAESFHWCSSAAEQGQPESQFQLAWMYVLGHGVAREFAEALHWFVKAGEGGNISAQHNLGFVYLRGTGVTRDAAEALRWFTQAAEQGKAESQYQVGRIYDVGDGAPTDYVKARYWYSRAAEQGLPAAQNSLGAMHSLGKGGSQDHARAIHWFTKAAEQGDAGAQTNS